jgi:arylsulfatase A-like enzyme
VPGIRWHEDAEFGCAGGAGRRFVDAYTTCPICVPARASSAIGRYVHDIEYGRTKPKTAGSPDPAAPQIQNTRASRNETKRN